MPIPLILGIGAAAAGLVGAGSAVAGVSKMKNANDLMKEAEIRNKRNVDSLEKQNKSTTAIMDELGKKELEALSSFDEFTALMENFHGKPRLDAYDANGVKIPEYNAKQLTEVSIGAGLLLNGLGSAAVGTAGGFAAAGVTTSAVMALGTASTGTAISALSGVAATNATLAALGGGAIAAGGGGVALGTTILGATTLGAGLLVGGIVFNIAGSKLSDKAEEAHKQMLANEKEINEICKYLSFLSVYAGRFKDSLEDVYDVYQKRLQELRSLIEPGQKYDWEDFSEEEQEAIENTMQLTGLLYEMCKVPVVLAAEQKGALNQVNTTEIDKAIMNANYFLESGKSIGVAKAVSESLNKRFLDQLEALYKDLDENVLSRQEQLQAEIEEDIQENEMDMMDYYLGQQEMLKQNMARLEYQLNDFYKKAVQKDISVDSLDAFKKLWDKSKDDFDSMDQKITLLIGKYEAECNIDRLSVAVIAPMSGGKSTLLNAMIGRELLPSKNEACTATITTILDDDNAETFTAKLMDWDGEIIRNIFDVTAADLDSFNENRDVAYIDIRGNIESIRNKRLAVEFVDTPGPNNSLASTHGDLTRKVLAEYPLHLVLYVLNATQLGINDDYMLLREVIDGVEKDGRGSRDERIIFVVNKCDLLDPDDGENIETIMQSVKEYLEGHGFTKPQIIPVSALIARLIRQLQCGERLTNKERADLEGYIRYLADEPKMFLERYAEIPDGIKRAIDKDLMRAEENFEKEKVALIHTGIPTLEALIESML